MNDVEVRQKRGYFKIFFTGAKIARCLSWCRIFVVVYITI